jgi:streptogramin lyase
MNKNLTYRRVAIGVSLLLAWHASAQNLVVSTIINEGAGVAMPQTGIAVDAAGNLYFADQYRAVIERISPTGVLKLIAGRSGVLGSTDGPASSALFFQPVGIALDSAGNIYVADRGKNTIRKITPAGIVSTLAGIPGSFGHQDGPGSSATFNEPQALAIDAAGNLYVADSGNEAVRDINPAGTVSTLAPLPFPVYEANLQHWRPTG